VNMHMEAQQLLPWLANGTLADPELTRVQAHLEACAACRAELALLHTLRATGPAAAPGYDMEGALARLMPQLDAPAPLRWRDRLAANDRYWLRAGMALQCCVIVALGVLLARSPAAPDSHYRALAATPGARSSMVVAFKPDTPERELRRILHARGARVVGGPTATGAWLIETEGEPAAVARSLHAEPAVTLAESLGAEGRP
jgi:anti-sigma factor RsiW